MFCPCVCVLSYLQAAVEGYVNDVFKVYASTFVRDVIVGRCVKSVTNERLIKVPARA